MKILIYSPDSYSLNKTISLGFFKKGFISNNFDYRKYINPIESKIYYHRSKVKYNVRAKIEKRFFKKVNILLINEYQNVQPDIVFIYNNEMFLERTIKIIKKQSKIIFYLGDNPYYTPTNDYFISLLRHANLIVVPDSFWVKQLKVLGLKNLHFDFTGYNPNVFKKVEVSENLFKQYKSDMFFLGGNYSNTWGYKRSYFLSKFINLDIKIYGSYSRWSKWFDFFPELKDKFVHLDSRISDEQLNIISNCCKVYPVDRNPGLLSGIHVRVFDCIGSGILPLVEYGEDIPKVFKDVKIPIINNYTEAEKIAGYYIKKNSERECLSRELRDFVYYNYMPWHFTERILKKL